MPYSNNRRNARRGVKTVSGRRAAPAPKPAYNQKKPRSRSAARRRKLNVPGIAGLVAVCAAIVWLLFSVVGRNAVEVFAGSQSIGFISYSKASGLTAEDLENTVESKIAETAGTAVEINEEILVKRAHAPKKDLITTDAMLALLSQKVTYKVQAAVITVNGAEAGSLANIAEAEALFDSIISPYITEGAVVTEKGFAEDVQATLSFIDPSVVVSADVVKSKLLESNMVKRTYTVASGDSLYSISRAYGITVDELLTYNPEITVASSLKVGQQISVYVPQPLVSVKTVETVTETVTTLKTTEYLTDTTKPASYRKVVQQGKDGKTEKVVAVTKINGIAESQTVISETVVQAAVPEIISVGV